MIARPPGRWPLLAAIALIAAIAPSLSAFFRDPSPSPNAAAAIAVNIAAGRGYQVYGRDADGVVPAHPGYRAYHLPGEPFYLAFGFRVLPADLYSYLHVPVVVLLITAAAAFAWTAGGQRCAIAAAAILCLDPFVAVHGPVYDDTMLAAALVWTALWLTIDRIDSRSRPAMATLAAIAAMTVAAALTRAEAQSMLLTIGAALLMMTRLPATARRLGATMAAAVVVAIGGWTSRNAIVLGEPIAGTTHDGKTLFESTFRTARDAIRATGVAQEFDVSRLPPGFENLGWLGEIEADTLFRREAWRYISTHPGDVILTGLSKTAISVLGLRANLPLTSPRNVVPMLFNGAVIAAAAIGWRRWRRGAIAETRRAVDIIIAAVLVWTFAGLMLGPVGLRYRMTFGVLMAIGAAQNAAPRAGVQERAVAGAAACG